MGKRVTSQPRFHPLGTLRVLREAFLNTCNKALFELLVRSRNLILILKDKMSDFEDEMEVDGPGIKESIQFSSENTTTKGKRIVADLPVEAEDNLPWYVASTCLRNTVDAKIGWRSTAQVLSTMCLATKISLPQSTDSLNITSDHIPL